MTSEARAKGANHEDRTSYETSKRLAELGYDGKACGYWLAPLVTENYKQPEPLWSENTQDTAMAYRDAGGDVNEDFYYSYSMHTLSLALQKYSRDISPADFNSMSLNISDKFYFNIQEYEFNREKKHIHLADPNPCEAMGLALIKVLERRDD